MVRKPSVFTSQTDDQLLAELREAAGYGPGGTLRRQLQDILAGDYEVLQPVGEGACGIVFRARDTHLDRVVAIKCPANPSQRRGLAAMFEEARTMARINHPNVVAIYALSEHSDPPHMVMEFVEGLPIDQATADLALDQRIHLFRQVLRGVAELHRKGIVHRDLKPANILVDGLGRAKVLDMGIAERVPAGGGPAYGPPGVRGTPAYMAPEQSVGAPSQPMEDVFALGVVLFELLTGQRPFGGTTTDQVLEAIRMQDPPLPRALRGDIPGPVQAICLTALEKDPAKRYPSARHFLLDVDRYLSGEAVVADPSLLADVLDHGIERHIDDLARWQKDRLISARESDYFSDHYRRLRQREEFWILDSRRISFSQVALHLGAWSCVVAAYLMLCFQWEHLPDWQRIAVPAAILLPLLGTGLLLWKRRTRRVAVVLLIAATLTWPLLTATVFQTTNWLDNVQVPYGGYELLPTRALNNIQFLLTAGTTAALGLLLWRRTRTGAFSLVTVVTLLALATAGFSLVGLRALIDDEHWDSVGLLYLSPGLLFVLTAMILDLRYRQPYLAGPFHVVGVLVVLGSLSAIAEYGPTTKLLGLSDLEHGREYSFMLNGLLYLGCGLLADRSVRSFWLRRVATALFWLTPSHLLVPVLLLELDRAWPIFGKWNLPQLALPLGALIFAFASVPKQMKSFFLSGLAYTGAGVQRLTERHFQDELAWPIALAFVGFLLAIAAWRRPGLFDRSTAPRRAHRTASSSTARSSPEVSMSKSAPSG